MATARAPSKGAAAPCSVLANNEQAFDHDGRSSRKMLRPDYLSIATHTGKCATPEERPNGTRSDLGNDQASVKFTDYVSRFQLHTRVRPLCVRSKRCDRTAWRRRRHLVVPQRRRELAPRLPLRAPASLPRRRRLLEHLMQRLQPVAPLSPSLQTPSTSSGGTAQGSTSSSGAGGSASPSESA